MVGCFEKWWEVLKKWWEILKYGGEF